MVYSTASCLVYVQVLAVTQPAELANVVSLTMLSVALEFEEVHFYPLVQESATYGQWLYLQRPFDVWINVRRVLLCCEQCSSISPSCPSSPTTFAPPPAWAQTKLVHLAEWIIILEHIELCML